MTKSILWKKKSLFLLAVPKEESRLVGVIVRIIMSNRLMFSLHWMNYLEGVGNIALFE